MSQAIPNASHHAWNENSRKAELEVAELEAAHHEMVFRLHREPQTGYVRLILWQAELDLVAGVVSIWLKYAMECLVQDPRFPRHFIEGLPYAAERYREICAKISGCLDPGLVTRLLEVAQYYQRAVDMFAAVLLDPNQHLKADESERQIQSGPEALKQKQRADRRQSIVQPILASKGWARAKLATEAGVSNNSVYEYLNGRRKSLRHDTRQAIADVLGLKQEGLPD